MDVSSFQPSRELIVVARGCVILTGITTGSLNTNPMKLANNFLNNKKRETGAFGKGSVHVGPV